jgi:hypothetical protein
MKNIGTNATISEAGRRSPTITAIEPITTASE